MNTAKLIEIFAGALENPENEVRPWKTEHKSRAVGFMMTDVPEELIHAAGLLPYGITGGNTELEKADAHMQAWTCSYTRSCLALALSDKLDFLDGLIIPQTCDTTRMLLDLWKQIRPLGYMEDYRLPRQVERPSAGAYLARELLRIKQGLENFTGKTISNDALSESIVLFNGIRKLLRRVYAIHSGAPALISNRDLYTLINGTMAMPREKAHRLLTEICKDLEKRLNGRENSGGMRLILSGTLLTPLEFLDLIDEWGGVIVGDDFQNGYRYIEADVKTTGDPIMALAERQLKRIPSAAYDRADKPRRLFLADMAGEKKAQGVIFLHINFCEPENFDYYDNLLAIQQIGIPAVKIETHFGRSTLGQLQTRIQAFMELVGGESR